MFSYRRLFLTVTMLASIVLADILVQPGYEHQASSNPHYLHQILPQYQFPVEQYRAQLPNQKSARYLLGAQNIQNLQTLHPHYEPYQDGARSHLLKYPHRLAYHRYQYLPRPHHLHYAKVGGHGYVRPSVFVGYPQPLIVPNRYKRSRKSDPTSSESSKSEVVAHDNDVAAKSALSDSGHPTAVDSLLPEHEPTNTNDKHVKNRQIPNDQLMKPRLFGLYPEKMYSKHQPSDTPNKMQHMMIPQFHSTDSNLNTQSSIVSTQQMADFQKSVQDEVITNMDMISMDKPKQNKFTLHIPSYPKKSPKVYQCMSNTAVSTTSVQPSQSFINNVQNRYRNNGELSKTYEIFDAPYFDKIDRPLPNYYSYYSDNYPYYSNYDSDKYSDEAYSYVDFDERNFDSVDGMKPPIRIPDYVFYTNTSAWSNLTPASQTQTQLLDTYNYPPEKKTQAASSYYKHYDKAYPSDTLYNTFSSPVYY